MCIHLARTLPSLEKAHLPLHCITVGSLQEFLSLKEARQPAQGSLLTETVLIPGPGALIKMPRISSQGKSPWCTLPILEEMKAAFCRYEAPCLKRLCLVLSFFWGLSLRLVLLPTTSTPLAACLAPPPHGPRALQLSAQLPCTEASVAGVGEQAVLIICTDRSFSVLRPSFREVPALKSATLILVLLLPPS